MNPLKRGVQGFWDLGIFMISQISLGGVKYSGSATGQLFPSAETFARFECPTNLAVLYRFWETKNHSFWFFRDVLEQKNTVSIIFPI